MDAQEINETTAMVFERDSSPLEISFPDIDVLKDDDCNNSYYCSICGEEFFKYEALPEK
jgi:hypothetical protein